MSRSDSDKPLSRLEEEGEVAADYLEELLDIMDLDGDIVIDVENDRPSVAIVSDSADPRLERLVGEDGEVLEALQELTRLAVQTSMGERSRLMLDVAGYRAERRAELQAIASEAVEKVKATGDAVQLEPMNPFERKVCHDVAAAAGLSSASVGTEPDRCVVISVPEDDASISDEFDEDVVIEDSAVDSAAEEAVDDSAEVVEDGTGTSADLAAMEIAEEQ